ncbi:hypothetical protein [Alteromonas abrolhosensis]
MEHPGGSSDIVQNCVGYLDHHPGHNEIGGGYLEYITAFEFVEK